MASRTQPAIIVIGAGIIGASTAFHLAKSGAAPLVIEAGAVPGGAATAASWAWINASFGNPRAYFDLRMRSIAAWHELGRTLPALPLDWSGSLTFDLAAADLERYVAQHGDWGYRLRLVGPAEMAAIEPRLRDCPAVAAFCEDEGRVEPAAAAQILLAAAVEQGARVRTDTRVVRLIVSGDRISGVELAARGGADHETITADEVVIAAGIATPGLLATAGITLPLQQPEGLLIHTHKLPPVLRRLIVAPELHVRQTAGGRLVAGFDFSGATVDTPDRQATRLVARINTLLDLPEPARLSHSSIGLRPTPTDGFPAIGRINGRGGLYVAVMHSGITLAPAVGLFAARELIEGTRDPLLAPFAADRW